jgi:hypothetical protein
MNADNSFVSDQRLSAFIGGQHCFGRSRFFSLSAAWSPLTQPDQRLWFLGLAFSQPKRQRHRGEQDQSQRDDGHRSQ